MTTLEDATESCKLSLRMLRDILGDVGSVRISDTISTIETYTGLHKHKETEAVVVLACGCRYYVTANGGGSDMEPTRKCRGHRPFIAPPEVSDDVVVPF